MRIVGGSLRGRRLAAPPGGAVRPTSDRAREALFNRHVLDAFCGTGALGFEALSRGAARAVFIDNDDDAVACVRTNIAALGVDDRATVLRADATDPPRAAAACTLAFLDPPYAGDTIAAALPALAAVGWLAPDALCVTETEAGAPGPSAPEGFETLDSRSIGKACFTFLRFRP